jgi:tetratricopeptide (TPR) repeat protein
MVRAGLGDDSGAKLIEQRGIDFAPSEDFYQTLKATGASEAFLKALRAAKPPVPASAKKALNQVQIFALLVGQVQVPSHRVTMLVQERGIDFEPTDDYLQEVRLAGGEDELISALKSAKVTKPVTVDPMAQARQAEVRQHLARAGESYRAKRYADAEAELRAAVRLAPEDAELHDALGAVLGENGDWEGEIFEEREALRQNPNLAEAHVNLGRALGEKGDWDGSIAEERAALRLAPNFDVAHVNLGRALAAKGDWGGDIAEQREALRLNPKNEIAHAHLGAALGGKHDWDGDIVEQREALRLNPNNEMAHVNLGMALGNRGDWDGEISEEHEALRLNPNNEVAHLTLGAALGGKHDWNGQIAEEREVLRLDPDNEIAHLALGAALGMRGDWDGEIVEEREALRLNPNDEKAHVDLGLALGAKRDWDGASAEFRDALRLNPKNAAAHASLGLVLGTKGDFDGEIAEEREALSLNPNDAFAHGNLGHALAVMGDADGAISEYREALRLDPSNALAHAALGDALEKKGNQPGALEEYRAAYMVDPKNATYKQNYERLLQPSSPIAGPTPQTDKHPGVWVSGYGYPAGSFQSVYMGLVDFLSSSRVAIANRGAQKFTNPNETGFMPLSAILEVASKAGADSLLYVKTERNEWQGVTTIYMQCFDSAGRLLWEEKATSPWANGSPGIIRSGWKKKLAPHVGKPGLILKQAQQGDPLLK